MENTVYHSIIYGSTFTWNHISISKVQICIPFLIIIIMEMNFDTYHLGERCRPSECMGGYTRPPGPSCLSPATWGKREKSRCEHSWSRPCRTWWHRTCHLPALASCGSARRWAETSLLSSVIRDAFHYKLGFKLSWEKYWGNWRS